MRRDLVQRAMAHDHEAFTELARLAADKLYAVARLILRDPERAEDATQETLVAAWRDIAALRDPDRFEPWIRRLLVRECYREARKGRERYRMELQVDAIEVAVPDASREVADRDQLERGFRHLTPEQRALVVLRRGPTDARVVSAARPVERLVPAGALRAEVSTLGTGRS